MAPRIAVIIVAFNSGPLLERCVRALLNQSFGNFEAVIWDNASTDGAVEALAGLSDGRLRIVRSATNLGFAGGNNRAVELTSAPLIATLNPDAVADEHWLERLQAAATETCADAVASLQLDANAPGRLDGAGDCMSFCGVAWRGGYGSPVETAPSVRCEVFAACAAAALYRRDTFEALGGFEERFFCYFEDVDLGYRIRLAGGRCVFEPSAVVRHVGSASTGKGSDFSEYHGARNRLWTFMRNTPLWLAPVALPAHILVTAYVVLRTPALRGPRLRGLRDAWRGRRPFLRERRRRPFRLALAKSLTWSPLALSRRAIKALPLRR